MIELYLSKVTETSESELAGKLYARVSYKQTLSIQDMAHHMADHNTAFSEGTITGILIDFVKCIREQVLNGNTVKIDNLAIFKATVEGNGLETLYDAESDKVAMASIGTLPTGAKTGKLSWSDKTKAEIAAAKGETTGGSSNTNPTSGGTNTGTNTGGQNQGGGTDNNGGGDNGGGLDMG